MSFIHNTILKKSGRSNAARHLEPRLFSVAIKSLGTDADE